MSNTVHVKGVPHHKGDIELNIRIYVTSLENAQEAGSQVESALDEILFRLKREGIIGTYETDIIQEDYNNIPE